MANVNSWKKLRVKLGYRKEELARKAGISSRTIIRLEAGDPSVSPETKSKIKNALVGNIPVRFRI
jgi:DNA-binding XRE family transcriptional regulator